MYRRHDGPGRLDLHAVKTDGNSILILSALVKSVRLAGEYANRSKGMVTAITHDENVADETRRFCRALSTVLELPEIGASECSRIRTSIHVNELPDRTVQLAVTSPAARHEVGPKLLISKLFWGQND